MKKILITGGAGFIGFHLAKLLMMSGYDITIVDNFARAVLDDDLNLLVKNKGVRICDIDVLNSGSLIELGTDYQYIFHLAAIIGVTHVLSKPYTVLYDNVRLLGNVIDFARQQKALKRMLFASTSEVYAGTLKKFAIEIPTPETTPLAITELSQPRTSYMLSKIYGEAMCLHSGLPVTSFRPHNIYGPRMGLSHVIPEQLKKAELANDGDVVEVFSVDHTRAFCYVDDAVKMLMLMMNSSPCEGNTLNLGVESSEITIQNVAEICHLAANKKLVIKPMPATPGSPTRRSPDMSKTFDLIDYKPIITLEDGIARTYDWYKSKVFAGGGVSAK